MILIEFLTGVADALRSKLDTATKINAQDFPQKIDAVYEVGMNNGYTTGRQEGYQQGYESGYTEGETLGTEAGKQEMHTAFWNMVASGGNRTVWDRSFSRWSIKSDLFRPPYTLKVTGVSSQMFYLTYADKALDIQALEEELGYPIFDTSSATRLDYFNQPGIFSTLGEIDLSKCTTNVSLAYVFATNMGANYLTSIKKLIVTSSTYFVSSMFNYCSALTHCPFEGTIGKSGLTMSACTSLDKESLTSIVYCLSADTSGLAVTLSLAAVNKAFETLADEADGSTSVDWTTLVNTKPNWTISLA